MPHRHNGDPDARAPLLELRTWRTVDPTGNRPVWEGGDPGARARHREATDILQRPTPAGPISSAGTPPGRGRRTVPAVQVAGIVAALAFCLEAEDRPLGPGGLLDLSLALAATATVWRGRASRRPGPSGRRPRIGTAPWLPLLCVFATLALWIACFLRFSAAGDTVAALALAGLGSSLLADGLLRPRYGAAAAFAGMIVLFALAWLAASGVEPVPVSMVLAAASVAILFGLAEIGRLLGQRRDLLVRLASQDAALDSLLVEAGAAEPDWTWASDRDWNVVELRARAGATARVPVGDARADGLPRIDWREWVREGGREGGPARAAFRRLARATAAQAPYRDLVLPVAGPAGKVWLSISARPLFDADGGFCGYRGIATDVTARREAELRSTHEARHDRVTGMVNRDPFIEVLQATLDGPDAGFHVMMVDLDGFRLTNLQHGREIGDLLLRAVAKRLVGSIRNGDMVARLHDGQFALMIHSRSPADGRVSADRLIRRLCEPYSIEGRHFALGANIGVSHGPTDSGTPVGLMRAADVALMSAKTAGTGNSRVFLPTMEEAARDRRAMQLDLAVAIERAELSLAYQPVVDLADGGAVSAEALLRWTHRFRGSVPPSVFIGVAEEAGLIGSIGAFVLAAACREVAIWPEHVKVAVNVSPLQFHDPNLARDVVAALRDAAIGPNRIELEVTESVMMEASPQTLATLHELREVGVRMALDDFGTGFSSLSYLSRFPFDRVKIDRSFVSAMEHSSGSVAIVRAIIELARGLGMQTTAEGVETAAQLDMLATLGCTHAQGYHLSRPVDATRVRELLRTGLTSPIAH